MSCLLLFLLSFYQFQTLIQSELLNGPTQLNSYSDIENDINSIIPPGIGDDSEENDIINELPLIRTGQDEAEVEFRQPIKSVNIDYSKNSIALKFQKQHLPHYRDETDKFYATDFMRFGKRAYELGPSSNDNSIQQQKIRSEKGERFERSPDNFNRNGNVGLRDSRGDNFMRFGRSPADFMRLGRSPADFMRLGRDPGDFMRFGRSPGQDFMRFGRAPADFMRLGRNPGQDFMRFGRAQADFMRFGRSAGQDFMRFGRSPGQDYMRFGRAPADFMRFGRSPSDFMRLGRSSEKITRNSDKNFMRFGRPDNFMRFGRSQSDGSSNFMRLGRSSMDSNPNDDKDSNHTSAALDQKNEIKAVAKIIHESRHSTDDSNPMDKAIQVLFNKQSNPENELPKAEDDNNASETQDYRR